MSARIDRAGVYDLPERVYHADPVITPSLSSSLARLLLTRSPLHAQHAHPRLSPQEPKCPSDAMEWGSIVHKLFLNAGPEIVECDFDDWRSREARNRRAEARAAGALPVLGWKLCELQRCADAAREQVRAYPEIVAALAAGKAEQAIVWQEGATWCRSLLDWLPDDHRAPLLDLKTTGESAAPQAWERKLAADYAVQAAFYLRGLKAVRGRAPADVRFIVVELDPPHALSVLSPSPSLLALANEMVDEALDLWRECLRTGKWPGYPPLVAWVDVPSWVLMQREERRARSEWIRDQRPTDGEIYQRLLAVTEGMPPS